MYFVPKNLVIGIDAVGIMLGVTAGTVLDS